MTLHVLWAGNVSTVIGAATVVLVLTRHRLAPAAAVAAGLPVAIGVSAVHLLPAWFGPLSDSFLDGAKNVTWMSWTARGRTCAVLVTRKVWTIVSTWVARTMRLRSE